MRCTYCSAIITLQTLERSRAKRVEFTKTHKFTSYGKEKEGYEEEGKEGEEAPLASRNPAERRDFAYTMKRIRV